MNYIWGVIILLPVLFLFNRISYWGKITQLGFASETPEFFMKRPNIYSIIGLLLIFLTFLVSNIRWYVVLPLLVITLTVGNGQARKKYQQIISEMDE